MTYRPPGNPNKLRTSKVRWFDGIMSPQDKVLRRTNERGWDISNSVANEVWDFDLGVRGAMKLRPGARKINDTGRVRSIDGLIYITLGSTQYYGVIFGGDLDVIDIPQVVGIGQDVLTMVPATTPATTTTEYPITDPSVEP